MQVTGGSIRLQCNGGPSTNRLAPAICQLPQPLPSGACAFQPDNSRLSTVNGPQTPPHCYDVRGKNTGKMSYWKTSWPAWRESSVIALYVSLVLPVYFVVLQSFNLAFSLRLPWFFFPFTFSCHFHSFISSPHWLLTYFHLPFPCCFVLFFFSCFFPFLFSLAFAFRLFLPIFLPLFFPLRHSVVTKKIFWDMEISLKLKLIGNLGTRFAIRRVTTVLIHLISNPTHKNVSIITESPWWWRQ